MKSSKVHPLEMPMQENPHSQPAAGHSSHSTSGQVPNSSESFGTVPHSSEPFRSVPNASASFRTVPKTSERTASHTLTVREVAKMFEVAGVSRTERSIVNWCLPNKHDIARLDAVFDANERRWFITQESVDRAIAEEQARGVRQNEPIPKSSEEPVPNHSEPLKQTRRDNLEDRTDRVSELQMEMMNLQILNKGKDLVIEHLRQEREGIFHQLVEGSRRIGELESELRQLSTTHGYSDRHLPDGNENTNDMGNSA